MKTRIEDAFELYVKNNLDYYFGLSSIRTDHDKKVFIAGAEFMQNETQAVYNSLIDGAARDTEMINKLKSNNDLMEKALRFYINYSDDSEVAYDVLEKIGDA
jgi:hypothetical protein